MGVGSIRGRGGTVFAVHLLASCGGADPGAGLDLWMRVPGAQLVRGDWPSDTGGPAVTFLDLRSPTIVAGRAGAPVAGRSEVDALAVHVGLEGDAGRWIVPVGLPDPAVAGELDWQASMDFSRDLPPGETVLLVAAVDSEGRAGGVRRGNLLATDGTPAGELVVSLEWDTQADVDLLVTDPGGVQIGPKDINSYEPPEPGEPPDPPDAWEQGGLLDLDSNSDCVLDGIRRENAVWAHTPPPGTYVVHVAMTRPCGEVRASFRVVVNVREDDAPDGGAPDREIARAEGVLYEIDSRIPGGLRVLEFER
jgi:hypothetical protein